MLYLHKLNSVLKEKLKLKLQTIYYVITFNINYFVIDYVKKKRILYSGEADWGFGFTRASKFHCHLVHTKLWREADIGNRVGLDIFLTKLECDSLRYTI